MFCAADVPYCCRTSVRDVLMCCTADVPYCCRTSVRDMLMWCTADVPCCCRISVKDVLMCCTANVPYCCRTSVRDVLMCCTAHVPYCCKTSVRDVPYCWCAVLLLELPYAVKHRAVQTTDIQTDRRLGLQLQAFFSLAVGGSECRFHNPAYGKFFFATFWMGGCVGSTRSPVRCGGKNFARNRNLIVRYCRPYPRSGTDWNCCRVHVTLCWSLCHWAECMSLCAGHCVTGQGFIWALRSPLRSDMSPVLYTTNT